MKHVRSNPAATSPFFLAAIFVWLSGATAGASSTDAKGSPELVETLNLGGQYIWRELVALGFLRVAAYVAITAVAGILIAWWASSWFTKSHASGKNALLLFGWWLGFAIFGVVGAVLLFRSGLTLGAIAFFFIMFGVGAFASPMKVYEFTVTMAAGFLACWVILNAVLNLVLGGLLTEGEGMPWTRLQGKSPSDRLAFLRRELESEPKTSVAPSATPKAPAPAAASTNLKAMYDALQKERATLDMADKDAVAAFNKRAAEYKALVGKQSPAPSAAPAVPARK